jgi:hypothetical protein
MASYNFIGDGTTTLFVASPGNAKTDIANELLLVDRLVEVPGTDYGIVDAGLPAGTKNGIQFTGSAVPPAGALIRLIYPVGG